MSKLLEEAMQVLRELPEDRQEAAARAMLNYVADEEEVLLSDEQVAEMERRISSADRKFIAMTELDKRIRHLGV